MQELIDIIERGFETGARMENAAELTKLKDAVADAIQMLDTGEARVAEKIDGDWHVHQWLKKAVLLSFRLSDNKLVDGGYDLLLTPTSPVPPPDVGTLGPSESVLFTFACNSTGQPATPSHHQP